MMYLCELTPDDNGTFLVTCPAFPEVTTFGEDRAQAWLHAIGALEEAIAARIADGDPLRPATEAQMKRRRGVWVKLPLLTVAQSGSLHGVARAEHVTRRARPSTRMAPGAS
jgi:predicted RNase H-like HicB family nuclease